MQSKWSILPLNIFRLGLLILMAALPFARAFVSIGTGLLFIAALLEFIINRPQSSYRNIYFICITLLFTFCLLDGFRAENMNDWVKEIEIKLPLILCPFAVLQFGPKISGKIIIQTSVVLAISVSICSVLSGINYYIHYEAINQEVLHSKNVPIIGDMHHITFSVYAAFVVIVSLYLFIKSGIKWMLLPLIINFIGLHIFTARTGLLGLYFALAVLGFIFFIKIKAYRKYIATGIAIACILPIVAFYAIGSFHNRVINSMDDAKVIWEHKDANYQSMGMRVEAMRTAFDIIALHPFTGVGCSNISSAMAKQYEVNNTNLYIENRILPHNQIVMEGAMHGWLGIFIITLFFALPLFIRFTHQPTLFIGLWALLLFACMFESMFQRQHGVLLAAVFWFLYQYSSFEKSESSKI